MNKVLLPVLFFMIVIAALSFTISNMLYGRSAAEAQAQSVTAINASPSQNLFTRTLSLGDTGQDVLLLQQILNQSSNTQIAESGIGSPGSESTYFGAKTRLALIIFQQQYGVGTLTTTNGVLVGTGIANVATEQQLSYLYVAKQNVSYPAMTLSPASAVKGKPQISSISPSVVSEGGQVIITGNNFDFTNTITSSFEAFPAATSTDGRTIIITIHSLLEQQLNKKLNSIKDSDTRKKVRSSVLQYMQKDFSKSLIQGIPFTIQVENSVGESNPITLYYKLN